MPGTCTAACTATAECINRFGWAGPLPTETPPPTAERDGKECIDGSCTPQSVLRDKSAVTAAPATTPTRSAVMLTIRFLPERNQCRGRPDRGPAQRGLNPELNNGGRQYAAIRLCGCSTPGACRVYVFPTKRFTARPPRPELGLRWAPALAAVSRSSRPRLGSRLRMHSPLYWSR